MKKALTVIAGTLVASAWAIEPSIKEGCVIMSQSADRKVTVSYEVEDGPAIVTVDVYTNCTQSSFGASVGGGNLWTLGGEVNRKVATGVHSFTWLPHLESWGRASGSETTVPGPRFDDGVRVVVTAWSLSRPPDYMVVEIPTGKFTYYPAEAFIPRGVHASEYKTQKMIMRLVPAASWTTPWLLSTLKLGPVLLTDNYYLGIFELTQRQYSEIGGSYAARHSGASWVDSELTPMHTYMSFSHARTQASGQGYDKEDANVEPDEPTAASILGKLNAKANVKGELGMVFDLPTEAQWEFACCAGRVQQAINVAGKTIGEVAWYQGNAPMCPTHTQPCYLPQVPGQLASNAWGFYDMIGNVAEYCRDFNTQDASRWAAMATEYKNVDGVYVNPFIGKSQTEKLADYGTSKEMKEGNRVRRGGGTTTTDTDARISATGRDNNGSTWSDHFSGIRVACRPVTAQ